MPELGGSNSLPDEKSTFTRDTFTVINKTIRAEKKYVQWVEKVVTVMDSVGSRQNSHRLSHRVVS